VSGTYIVTAWGVMWDAALTLLGFVLIALLWDSGPRWMLALFSFTAGGHLMTSLLYYRIAYLANLP
jgi:hypothetical protein